MDSGAMRGTDWEEITLAEGAENYCVPCDMSFATTVDHCINCGNKLLHLQHDKDDLSGTTLGGTYEVEGRIGSGGMGTVYRAIDLRTRSHVAVKLIEPHLAKNLTNAKRFLREAKLASRLQHRNVVTIYNFGQSDDGLLYIAMELLSGLTLRQRAQRRLTVGECLAIARQVGEALDYAHGLGIVHRDLKPDNVIVLDDNGSPFVKVLDFGLAKSLEDDEYGTITRSGIVLGTPNYISPELAKGEPADGRSDIYSLGVMLYEMICGRLPFIGDSPPQILTLQAFTPHRPLPSTVPAGVSELVDCMLAKKPSERPARASNLVDSITKLEETLSATEMATVVHHRDDEDSKQTAIPTMMVDRLHEPKPPTIKPKRNKLVFAAAFMIVAAVGPLVISLTGDENRGETMAEESSSSTDTSQVIINPSIDENTQVFFDGKILQGPPYRVETEQGSKHSVIVSSPGYETHHQDIVATSSSHSLRVELRKLPESTDQPDVTDDAASKEEQTQTSSRTSKPRRDLSETSQSSQSRSSAKSRKKKQRDSEKFLKDAAKNPSIFDD